MTDDHGTAMSTGDRLLYMAHQIERNLAVPDPEDAVSALHEHLVRFWDPGMKARICEIARARPDRVSPVVARAVARLTPSGGAA